MLIVHNVSAGGNTYQSPNAVKCKFGVPGLGASTCDMICPGGVGGKFQTSDGKCCCLYVLTSWMWFNKNGI